MKKIVALMLTVTLCFAMFPALAAGRLTVVQENYHYVSGWSSYAYAYAKVENTGDRPIKVNAGVFEIYDANGEVLTSDDYVQAYATYLQPGEYTYVKIYEDLDEGQIPDDYMMTLTGKSDKSKIALRLPVETRLEMDVKDGWWEYNYMYALVTNNTDETLFGVDVVLALLDAEGNILYIDSNSLYSTVGINPGSSVTFRMDINSTFIEYFEANDLQPASVDAIAYVLIDNE